MLHPLLPVTLLLQGLPLLMSEMSALLPSYLLCSLLLSVLLPWQWLL